MWNSKHIFIHDYKLIETFLENYLLNYIEENKPDEWFFIRYWQGGPHIRLRYKIKDYNHKVKFENGLYKLVNKFREENLNHQFQNPSYDERIIVLEKVSDLKVYSNFSIEDIDYIPEINRYGGSDAMQYSENLFHESSKMASFLIRNVHWQKRYVIAFDLMYYGYKIVERLGLIDSKVKFFQNYNNVWKQFQDNKGMKSYIEILKGRLDKLEGSGKPISVYDEYLNKIESIFSSIIKTQGTFKREEIFYIMISHIHMLNNRLGLSPQNEYLLSKVFMENQKHFVSKEENYINETVGF